MTIHEKSSSDSDHTMTRRRFVHLGSLGVLTLGMVACSDGDDDDIQPPTAPEAMAVVPAPAYFPQSVATGDPRPDSVIFWTRVHDAAGSGDKAVRLLVGLDAALTNVVASADLTAAAAFDGVVKLKLMQLSPYTTYYYQFQYNNGSQMLGSRVGRTRTAPTPDMDVPARFAYVSCQDYRDRFYNVHADIARRDDLDFVVHLGDYIYETTVGGIGTDPDAPTVRVVTFSAPEEALDLGGNLAARSLSNYRDLYKTYRSDAALQAVHERFPMICIWDDHEFSDDSWKDHGTYFNGRRDERDTERKLNSERAYAEYMPLDFGLNSNGALVDGDDAYYPYTRIYRDFHYGKHLHLVLTDSRTFRPDHLVPEDAFPGTVALSQPVLQVALANQGIPWEAVRASFAAYADFDQPQLGFHKQVLTGVLTQQYLTLGLEPEDALARAVDKIQGPIALIVANPMIEAYNAAAPDNPLPLLEEEGLPRGLAYALLGKTSPLSNVGSRNFLTKSTYDLLASYTYIISGGVSEDIFGAEQDAWLTDTLAQSTASWRIMGNSIPLNSMVIDLSSYPVPPLFRNAFYVGVDHWDGFGNRRRALLDTLAQTAPRTLLIAGDVHSSHVTHHGQGVFEFTVAAVSSTPLQGFIGEITDQPPFNTIPGVGALVAQTNALLLAGHPRFEDGTPKLKYTRTDAHGYAVMVVTENAVRTTYHHIPAQYVAEPHYDNPLLGNLFERISFTVDASGGLQENVD